MGHLYLCQFLGCIEVDRELLLERFHYRFVTFGFNRGDGGDALGHDAVFLQCIHNFFLYFPHGACQPGKADAEVYDTRHVHIIGISGKLGTWGRYAQKSV